MFKATTSILLIPLSVVACSPHDQGVVRMVEEGLTTVLVGDSTAYSQTGSAPAGMATAWRYTATTSGTATKLNLCVSPGNASTTIYIGLYASNAQGTLPTDLIARATIRSPRPGFNTVSIPPVSVTGGTKYWLAALSPSGNRTSTFCAVSGSTQYGSRATATASLTVLPATYPSTGTTHPTRTAGIFASFTTQSGGGAGGSLGAGGQSSTGGSASGGASGAGGTGAGGKPASGGSASGGAPGAGGTGAGGKPASGGSSGTGGAYLRQYNETHVIYPTSQDISVALPTPVLQGSAILVFANEFSVDGSPPGSAPPRPIDVHDSTGASYVLLGTLNDPDDRAQAAAKSFVRPNAPAGPMTVTAHYVYDTDWDAVIVAEVAGVSATPLLASSARLVEVPNQAVDSATSGPMTFGTAPALVIGFSISDRAIFGPPLAGTGFTAFGTAMNWDGVEGTARQPSALLESRKVTSPGTVAATSTPAGGSPPSPDRLMTFGIVLGQ